MVKQRAVLAGLTLVAVAALATLWLRAGPGTGLGGDPFRGEAAEEPPRVDLARLAARAEGTSAGERNLFAFGQRRPRAAGASETPPPAAPPSTLAAPPPPVVAPPFAPSVPPLSVKYVGSVETEKGLRVAVLLTDKQEVLTGQAGDVIANRIKIVKIGYESIDIQDVGSDRVRRVPYKGN